MRRAAQLAVIFALAVVAVAGRGRLRVRAVAETDNRTVSLGDLTAPTDGALTVTQPLNTLNRLAWGAASDNVAVDHYRVVFTTGSSNPVSSCTDGTQIYNGTGLTCDHSSLTVGTTYRYRVCAYDAAANVSTGVLGSGVPTDQQAPTDNGSLAAAQTILARNDISWSAASDNVAIDHYRTVFLTGASAPAATCTDGTQACSSSGVNCNHTGLTDQIYSYRTCAYDAAGNVSAGITATSVRPFSDTNSFNPDGTNDYITIPDSTSFDGTLNHMSICLWISEATYNTADAFIGKSDTLQREWIFRIDATTSRRLQTCMAATLGLTACPNFCSDGADTLTNGTAAFVCTTYDGTQGTANNRLALYTNATLSAAKTCSGTIPAAFSDGIAAVQIGAAPVGANNPYGAGLLDEITYWNVTLTQANINTLCCGVSGGCSGVCTHAVPRADLAGISGLQAFYRIDGDTHPTATDSVGSNTGVYTNTLASVISTTIP